MDPLSITASIVAILQLTNAWIEYLDSVRDCPKDLANLADEASNLNSLLRKLRFRVETARLDEPWFNEIELLMAENGAFDQYRAILQQLYDKATAKAPFGKFGQALFWQSKKGEIDSLLSRMERLKSHIHIALELDHLLVNKRRR
jgi:hypothetical protein